jgi:hypothetical protein
MRKQHRQRSNRKSRAQQVSDQASSWVNLARVQLKATFMTTTATTTAARRRCTRWGRGQQPAVRVAQQMLPARFQHATSALEPSQSQSQQRIRHPRVRINPRWLRKYFAPSMEPEVAHPWPQSSPSGLRITDKKNSEVAACVQPTMSSASGATPTNHHEGKHSPRRRQRMWKQR